MGKDYPRKPPKMIPQYYDWISIIIRVFLLLNIMIHGKLTRLK